MTILIVPILIAMVVLAVLAWQAVRSGKMTVRRWAAAVLIVCGLASFPLDVISSAYLAIVPVGGCELAPWIREAWKAHGWAAILLWVIGGAAVLLAKGVRFSTRRAAGRAIVATCAVMLPLTVLDALAFQFFKDFQSPLLLAEALSPDGSRRATAFRTAWMDAGCCYVELEASGPHPLLSRKLGATSFYWEDWNRRIQMMSGDRSYDDALRRNLRLAWTRDGQAIVFWFADAPVVAYDLPRGTMLEASAFSGPGETPEARRKDRQAGFKAAVDRLLAEHGGPAGP